ncbi:gliding motility-associated C-terminal domain-containing protein [Leptobacterium sp. I13]|uniref:T9SS type B sorting domain-containing protein n=1 Tax=Leptobacterium meishanense TaxID=3128904 RepID=UPI0030EBB281
MKFFTSNGYLLSIIFGLWAYSIGASTYTKVDGVHENSIYVDTDGDGIDDTIDTDDDNDGNPDTTDPNPLVATAVANVFNATEGTVRTTNILANDDFIPGATISIVDLGIGTAIGAVTFNNITGEISYTPAPGEEGTAVYLTYQVCNTAVAPQVCATATILINVLPDTDGDGRSDITDSDDDNDGILDTVENNFCASSSFVATEQIFIDNFGVGTPTSNTSVIGHTFDATQPNDGGYVVTTSTDQGAFYAETNANPSPDADADGTALGRYLFINIDAVNFTNAAIYRESAIAVIPGMRYRYSISAAGLCDGCADIPEFSLSVEDTGGNPIVSQSSVGSGIQNDDIWRTVEVEFVATTATVNLVIINNQSQGAAGNDLGIDNVRLMLLGCDQDNDGVPNQYDLDADNDGTPDNIEAQNTAGYEAPAGTVSSGGVDMNYIGGISPQNTDGTDMPDFVDLDSDNDGVFDIVESGNGSLDTNNDGITDGTVGINGLDDLLDTTDDYLDVNGSYDTTQTDNFPDIDEDANNGGDVDYRDAITNDFDNDGISDITDLDDDNDGITDVQENTAIPSGQPDCSTTPSLSFSGTPVLESGIDLQQGAVYRYTTVTTGIDALVTIKSVVNAILITFDEDITDSEFFKPETRYLLGDVGSQGYVEYEISFVQSGTTIPVILPEFIANFIDIDGNTDYREQDFTDVPSCYITSTPSELSINLNSRLEATAGTTEYLEINNGQPLVNLSAIYKHKTALKIRFGAIATTAVNGLTITRQHGIQFSCLTNYINPQGFLTDLDGDGIINSLDLDSDNDGIYDVIESGAGLADTNQDGQVDGLQGTNGIPDAAEDGGVDGAGVSNIAVNSDNNTNDNPDYLDIDADDDGIIDNIEAQPTFSYIAPSGNDADGNGVDDNYDASPIIPINTDGTFVFNSDTVPDYLDLNSDGDGESDTIEAYDTDDDGIADTVPSGSDTDGDGLDDNFDLINLNTSASQNYTNGGQTALSPFPDTDSPGGEPNWRESQNRLTLTKVDIFNDENGDGIFQAGETIGYTFTITNTGNTALNNIEITDPLVTVTGTPIPSLLPGESDNTSYTATYTLTQVDIDAGSFQNTATVTAEDPNNNMVSSLSDDPDDLTDNDSDGDGNPDDPTVTQIDAITIDSDGDGIVDALEGSGDTDGDGIPDFMDIDSDNDGIPDNVEAQTTEGYIPPSGIDSDSDGLDDAYDNPLNEGLIPINTDNTDLPDYLDDDTDNDGVPDAIEGNDFNHDGIADNIFSGIDTDNDGLDDAFEGNDINDGPDVNDEINDPANDLPDTDGTEDVDYRDIDDDGDSVDTEFEYDVDNDNNGPDDTDGDGTPDYLDPDDDNDDIATIDENPDPNGDGNPEDAFDTDGDGTPDYLDPNNTTEGELEVFQLITPNGDGKNDVLVIGNIQDFPNNVVRIYNRWGRLVFETRGYNPINNFFDGRSTADMTINEGEYLPVGTYYYVINYVAQTGNKTIAGHLYINR